MERSRGNPSLIFTALGFIKMILNLARRPACGEKQKRVCGWTQPECSRSKGICLGKDLAPLWSE